MIESKDAWRFELLGGMRVVRGSTVIDQFRTQKTASLLLLIGQLRALRHYPSMIATREAKPRASRRYVMSMA